MSTRSFHKLIFISFYPNQRDKLHCFYKENRLYRYPTSKVWEPYQTEQLTFIHILINRTIFLTCTLDIIPQRINLHSRTYQDSSKKYWQNENHPLKAPQ